MNNKTQGGLTPMMEQYFSIKNQYPDSILFFRMGDFYEMFDEDAKTAAKILGITLTTRNKNKENAVPLCGIPYHALDSYIIKLIRAGHKVAICEQVEDPKKATGIVKRDVIRVVTPGTYLDTSLFVDKENTFLSSIFPYEDKFGFALLDFSTGEFRVHEFQGGDARKNLKNEINKTEPKEMLIPREALNKGILDEFFTESQAVITPYEDWAFEYDFTYHLLLEHFGVVSLAGFGVESLSYGTSAAGAVIHYIKETQKTTISHINKITLSNPDDNMKLDSSTIRSMELIKRSADNSNEGSLFGLLDMTVTAMGKRRLKKWITSPLLGLGEIEQRHEMVEWLKEDSIVRKELRKSLSSTYDMERIISKVTLKQLNPKDLISLKNSVSELPVLEKLIKKTDSIYSKDILKEWDNLLDVESLLSVSINEEAPLTLRDGDIIKDNYNSELDDLRQITKEGRGWIADLEVVERNRTGIQTLKIRYNNVYGYYIEITKKNLDKLPQDYIRKQSLVNVERFISQELKELETKILTADERIKELEFNLFEEIRLKISLETKRIQKKAAIISEIDVFVSFAEAAAKYNFTRPIMNEGDLLEIEDGRHPVVEQLNSGERFIPNSTYLNCSSDQIAIITGPNMAGKSTYLRQVAIIVLMAQIGCFVPVKKATIGIIDRIFTRVGAHDDLIKGQSTFMVEMTEAANILNYATKKSLIILDEIGRGTSTFDGISIAWAIAEFLNNDKKVGAKTLFATHYFELTELSKIHESIKNYNISIKEFNEEIIFLRKVMEGSADKSFGIQVARLAGIPEEVLKRAKEILLNLENRANKKTKEKKLFTKKYKQLDLFPDKGYDSVIDEIKKVKISSLTPLEALNFLDKIQKKCEMRQKNEMIV